MMNLNKLLCTTNTSHRELLYVSPFLKNSRFKDCKVIDNKRTSQNQTRVDKQVHRLDL